MTIQANEISVTARWVVPVEGEPIPWGIVTIANEVIKEVKKKHLGDVTENLGDAILIPALVNTHTHLDLSDCISGPDEKIDFIAWLDSVISHRLTQSPLQKTQAIQKGISELIKSGVCLVGDISAGGDSHLPLLESPIYSRVYFELIGLSEERASKAWNSYEAWAQSNVDNKKNRIGLSPHAPYSVHKELFTRAGETGLPVQVHLGEAKAEIELLLKKAGPFKDWLLNKGLYFPDSIAGSCEEVLDNLKLGNPLSIIHGTCLDYKNLEPGNLILCPRTQNRFSQGELPINVSSKKGWKVALGTDGRSSAPDLNVLMEACFVRREYPEYPLESLLRSITLSGANMLGFEEKLGSLKAGKSASLAVFPCNKFYSGGPLEFLFEKEPICSGLMVDGKWIFHPLH